jgi:hypothetical protein
MGFVAIQWVETKFVELVLLPTSVVAFNRLVIIIIQTESALVVTTVQMEKTKCAGLLPIKFAVWTHKNAKAMDNVAFVTQQKMQVMALIQLVRHQLYHVKIT